MFATVRFMALAAALALVAMTFTENSAAEARAARGLAWGTDNRWAKRLAKGGVSWYHHWQAGPVPEMPNGVHYVPMDWGPRYHNLWEQRKKYINKHHPSHVLAFNEPDVAGQANMSPKSAANRFMKELQPLRRKGIKVSSPQIVWNTKWMHTFMKHLHAQGGDVDFMAIHYYGSWRDVSRFQKFVKTVHKQFGKKVWITEYGVTASSGGSSGQIKAFQAKTTKWTDRIGYVERVAWLGCFAVSNPPDSFASRRNAMFASGGNLRSIAFSFIYGKRDLAARSLPSSEAQSTPGAKRHAMQHHRRIINSLEAKADLARRNETSVAEVNGFKVSTEEAQAYHASIDADDEDDDEPYQGEVEHCDEYCKLRDEMTKDTELDDDDRLDAEDDDAETSAWGQK